MDEILMKKKIIVIAGDVLCVDKIQGIPRFASECIKMMDKILDNRFQMLDVRVCYPLGKNILLPKLNNIQIVPITQEEKHFRMGDLRKYVEKNKALLVNMGPSVVLGKNNIITIHDVRPLEKTSEDDIKKKIQLFAIGVLAKIFKSEIVTVSNYQKDRIVKLLHIPNQKIHVIGNGWEHIKNVERDDGIFDKFSVIRKHEYYYSLGSVAPHKNYKWIFEVAKRNPMCQFVVAGNVSKKTWGIDNTNIQNDNIIYTGYINDEENISLLSNCKAFIHPSKYEGFGIPPLEALACGAKIMLSNATCLPEIFKDSAVYFYPDNYNINLDEMLNMEVESPKIVLEDYTWENAALKWLELFERSSQNE